MLAVLGILTNVAHICVEVLSLTLQVPTIEICIVSLCMAIRSSLGYCTVVSLVAVPTVTHERKKKTHYTPAMLAELEQAFLENNYPTRDDRVIISKRTTLCVDKIKVWQMKQLQDLS